MSPLGPAFFSPRGVDVLASELCWVWLPCALVAVLWWVVRRTIEGRAGR